MGENLPSQYGSTEFHNPAYYSDTVTCLVPSCRKRRRDSPGLKFFGIPQKLQENWCQKLKRNCPKRKLFVCEDHINTEQDCYRNKSGKLLLNSTANLITSSCPSEIEDDQLNSAMKEIVTTVYHFYYLRRLLRYHYLSGSYKSLFPIPIQHEDHSTKCDVAVQVEKKLKHQGVMAKPSTKSVGQNINISTSTNKIMPTQPQQIMDIMSTSTSGTSTPSIYEPSTSSESSECQEQKDTTGQYHILKLIEDDPKMFIGLPKNFFWLIEYLSKECVLKKLHIIITLFKIKQDDTMERIARHFDLNNTTVIKCFEKTLPVLATYFQNFIFLPKPTEIKKSLPQVFKPRYSNVQCLIDCFEIEIQKPSDPLRQAQTWSQYKGCNTVKYLIACCPNGFVCFISKGFGGRISDKAITESSGFIDILPPNAEILADRGFKGVDAALNKKTVKLLRPPSVSSAEKPTKIEVVQSKIIASLRVHVERVIRRVREFKSLKPHAVVDHQHIYYLDECVMIACALINLQGEIIKSI